VSTLDRTRLLSRSFMWTMGGVWIAVVTGLVLAAFASLPTGAISLAQLIAGVVLVIPFSRLMGAPLAVEWNRHR